MADSEETKWHLDKRVPLALIVAILAQTAGALFWASAIHFQVGANKEQIVALQKQIERAADVSTAVQVIGTKVEWVLTDVKDVKAEVKRLSEGRSRSSPN